MSNIFINTDLVARDAALELHGSLVTTAMIPDDVEQLFAQKVGDSVTVKKRPIMTASRHTGTGPFITAAIVEEGVNVAIDYRSHVKHKLTAQQVAFDVDDFAVQVTRPAMVAIAQDIDAWFTHNVLMTGFARNVSGTEGVNPSTLAHLAAAWKVLFDQKLSPADSKGVINSTAASNFLQLDQFINRDFGEERPNGLRNAIFEKVYQTELFPSNSTTTQERGDVGGTVTTNGVPVADAVTLSVTGFTAASGEVWRGARFTVAGDTTVYTVITDNVDIASNAAVLTIYPAVTADLVAAGSGAALTFKAAMPENVIFHPDGVARALIPPVPQRGNPSAVGRFEGIPIRVTFESSINNSDTGDGEWVLYDVFVGGNVIVPEAGMIMQG